MQRDFRLRFECIIGKRSEYGRLDHNSLGRVKGAFHAAYNPEARIAAQATVSMLMK
jgi:hypothetical protein